MIADTPSHHCGDPGDLRASAHPRGSLQATGAGTVPVAPHLLAPARHSRLSGPAASTVSTLSRTGRRVHGQGLCRLPSPQPGRRSLRPGARAVAHARASPPTSVGEQAWGGGDAVGGSRFEETPVRPNRSQYLTSVSPAASTGERGKFVPSHRLGGSRRLGSADAGKADIGASYEVEALGARAGLEHGARER